MCWQCPGVCPLPTRATACLGGLVPPGLAGGVRVQQVSKVGGKFSRQRARREAKTQYLMLSQGPLTPVFSGSLYELG